MAGAAADHGEDNSNIGGQGSEGGFSGGPKGASPRKPAAPPIQSLDFILDIPLKVTAELGRSKMEIRDVIQLSQGSVIELTKFVGEPLEVLVNDKLIARGEVVVVNEKFGIRITDIISPVERIEQLK
ncbi:MAG: flagellar motor switch protein FliN [Bdellovibrionia bacterium]